MKTLLMDKSPFLGCLVAALPWVKALTNTSDIKLNIRKNESCSYQTYSCDGNEFELTRPQKTASFVMLRIKGY
jgi:hypothetical protein